MAKVHNPLLFSKYFGIDSALLSDAGLIDPLVNVDTQLFIDPILLEKSTNQIIANAGLFTYRQHFENLVRLLKISKAEGDPAWKAARKLLDLSESAANGLGYGGTGRSGSSRPEELREIILRTCKEIITLGAEDPEMISLMGLFEENVGADTISDLTTRVVIDQLAEITNSFCIKQGISVADNEVSAFRLPIYTDERGRKRPMVLVPSDIVRDLPVANDWSDVERAASQNAELRDRINRYLGGIIQPTVADKKDALRRTALSSPDIFELFLSTIKENTESYDENEDALGYYKLKSILSAGIAGLKASVTYDLKGPEEVESLVIDTINVFKHHVEKGNLWEELYVSGKPKKERAAQLIYYAIADSFCKANDVDISPEANMGGGPIDFKFSSGYNTRVLVELKRSSGTVVHGYSKQLDIYRDASQTQYGIFVVLDFGGMGNKLQDIRRIQKNRMDAGQRASRIIVIDAKKKLSASRRA